MAEQFLSTPSARRATRLFWLLLRQRRNFYPRPPRGGRRPLSGMPSVRSRFLSTPSARRATACCDDVVADHNISIHALREEGDLRCQEQDQSAADFYPRPPRGGRPAVIVGTDNAHIDFYPRPPRGGRRLAFLR